MSAENISDHVLEQLRLIRAENDKRDRDFALMRAEFALFRDEFAMMRSEFSFFRTTIIGMLSTQADTLYQINDRLLALQLALEAGKGGGEA